MGKPVEEMRNLGPKSCEWLRSVGIATHDDLKNVGAVVAFRLVKREQPRASLNLLWALAAALRNRDWRELTDREKEQLRKEAGVE